VQKFLPLLLDATTKSQNPPVLTHRGTGGNLTQGTSNEIITIHHHPQTT